MVLPASDTMLSTLKNIEQEKVEICDELDLYFHDLKFSAMEEPESPTRKEKQISVDPISLIESSRREASFNLMLQPVISPDGPPPLPPLKPPLVSCSLPNSPRFSFALLKKKKWKIESQASPRQIDLLAYRYFAADSHPHRVNYRRTKSCGEGRSSAPADELDFWFAKPYDIKPEANKLDDQRNDEEFKCGALCMYLPGFGKGKPVRSKKEQGQEQVGNAISRTVSLEKFECGSWASSAIINDHEDGDSMNLYFDLPIELIRCSVKDASSPVSAAFIFDKDRKGMLKSGSRRTSEARKSYESARQVRFSTSSSTPTSPAYCITPRLRKAREDFNAFLEAQSA